MFSALFGGSGGKKKSSFRASKSKTSSSKGKSAASKAKPKTKTAPKKSAVRKIYKTTDGYFTNNPSSKKPRRVAVIKQRKDDGALVVCKIFKAKGKNQESSRFVQKLTLSPKKHKSLTEDSIVESVPRMGVKDKRKNEFKIIQTRDFEPTGDKLTKKEHQAIINGLGGGNKKFEATHKESIKRWENHFKE